MSTLRWSVASGIALAALVPAATARADNLGAIGQGLAVLVLMFVAVVILAFGISAWVLGRGTAPRKRWRAWYAGVTFVLTSVPGILLASAALSGQRHPTDALVFGGGLLTIIAFASGGQIRLFLRNWRAGSAGG